MKGAIDLSTFVTLKGRLVEFCDDNNLLPSLLAWSLFVPEITGFYLLSFVIENIFFTLYGLDCMLSAANSGCIKVGD